MTLFNRRTACLGLLALGGCGFRPIYGKGGTGAEALFGQIRYVIPEGELGYRIREALIRRFGPTQAGAPLVLDIANTLTRAGLAIEDDDEITRYNLTLTLYYALKRAAAPPSATPLAKGESRTIAAFNATTSQYATLVSEREVATRAGIDAVEKIVRRLTADYDPAWLA